MERKSREKKYWIKSRYETEWVELFLCLSPLTLFFTYEQGVMFENIRFVIVIGVDVTILVFLIAQMKYYEFYDETFVMKKLGFKKSKIVYYKNITDFHWNSGFAANQAVLNVFHLDNEKKSKMSVSIRKTKASLVKDKLVEQGYENIKFLNI